MRARPDQRVEGEIVNVLSMLEEAGLLDPDAHASTSAWIDFLRTPRGRACLLKFSEALEREKVGLGSAAEARQEFTDWFDELTWQRRTLEPTVSEVATVWVQVWVIGILIAMGVGVLSLAWQHKISWTMAVITWATLIWIWRRLIPNRAGGHAGQAAPRIVIWVQAVASIWSRTNGPRPW